MGVEKGWTLPTTKQIDNNRDTSNFGQILGGRYGDGTLYNEDTHGYWWGSEANNGAIRYRLYYDGSSLYTSRYGRYGGVYIRCVSEEKTVLDLTYMQDMTPAIASATPENTTASLTDRRDGKLYNVAKINGNMWMTQNLRFGYDATNPDTSTMQLTPDTSDIALSSERINPTSGQPETDDGFRELTTYDLVSRGDEVGEECRGTYDSDTGVATGLGYSNSCIHSGTITTSGDLATNWYNYALASAGTIIGTDNATATTESVCPKGWTLPSKTQLDSQRNITSFSPVMGGYYANALLLNETTYGLWWGSGVGNGASRYRLRYTNNTLSTANTGRRHSGFYIRCVQKST